MKILKIVDGFVTNSSSESTSILIAVRKDKSFKQIIEKLELTDMKPKQFLNFYGLSEEEIKSWCDFVELDHLRDEYNFLENKITTWISQEDYHIPQYESDTLRFMCYYLSQKGGKDLLVLDFDPNYYFYGTQIVVALRKGKQLGDMLEKIGLSNEYRQRFQIQPLHTQEKSSGWYQSDLKKAVENEIFDENIYELEQNYQILFADIRTDDLTERPESYYDEVTEFNINRFYLDTSDFRKKFYDKWTMHQDFPKRLIASDFILLHSITNHLKYIEKEKIRLRIRVKEFIENLKYRNLDDWIH